MPRGWYSWKSGSTSYSWEAPLAPYEVPVGFVVWNNGQYQANRRYLYNYGKRAAATGKYIGCWLGAPDIDNVSLAKDAGLLPEGLDLSIHDR